MSVAELRLIAAAVGLKLYVKAYPAGRRPLDGPQLDLLKAFNSRIHPRWQRELEKVMPIEGDLRAVDELITLGDCSCAIEAITRFVSVEAQVRRGRAKQRDLGATRLILLVKATHANRRLLADASPMIANGFPISSRESLRRLTAGQDPGGDSLILL